MEKIKALFIKLKDKFIKFCKWVWQECKDWHTVVIFAIVVVVMYSPVWGGYLCHALFGWKWCSVMATAYLAFWAGPFTPYSQSDSNTQRKKRRKRPCPECKDRKSVV